MDGTVCLADGALNVVLDGEEPLDTPGTDALAPGVKVTAATFLASAGRSGFEQYWETEKMARHRAVAS